MATATRLMHSRQINRRSSSCLSESCSPCRQRWSVAACSRAMVMTNRGSGMGPPISTRGGPSRIAWMSGGSGVRVAQDRVSSINRQQSGGSLIETGALAVTAGGMCSSCVAKGRARRRPRGRWCGSATSHDERGGVAVQAPSRHLSGGVSRRAPLRWRDLLVTRDMKPLSSDAEVQLAFRNGSAAGAL
jgi:hypothetical protein